jgi:hypothetical protein
MTLADVENAIRARGFPSLVKKANSLSFGNVEITIHGDTVTITNWAQHPSDSDAMGYHISDLPGYEEWLTDPMRTIRPDD